MKRRVAVRRAPSRRASANACKAFANRKAAGKAVLILQQKAIKYNQLQNQYKIVKVTPSKSILRDQSVVSKLVNNTNKIIICTYQFLKRGNPRPWRCDITKRHGLLRAKRVNNSESEAAGAHLNNLEFSRTKQNQ